MVDLSDGFKKCGFYTTRFIEADNAYEAQKKALDHIRKEYQEVVLNDISDKPILNVEELIEVESFGDALVPGKGASWYPEEEDSAVGEEDGAIGEIVEIQKKNK